jgi:hypothetical protein
MREEIKNFFFLAMIMMRWLFLPYLKQQQQQKASFIL